MEKTFVILKAARIFTTVAITTLLLKFRELGANDVSTSCKI